MDSSKHTSSKEGCSSSESGWTMYIASPMEEDDEECSGDDNSNKHMEEGDKNADHRDEESDDSMASDASSGPSHQQKLKNYRDNYGKAGPKHDKSANTSKGSSTKKSHRKENGNDENNSKSEGRFRAFKKYWK
ncbi:protein SOB FIVE-LIKE 3-like [Tripterygium wilfordii]|nr:protein SOB FIVE-LIKE 3-like [Tripterygium wilfordii]